MSPCCCDNVNLSLFSLIQRAGTSAFAFSRPVMSVLCVNHFHCWSIRFESWKKEKAASDLLLVWFFFLYDEYVCASTHVFWYIPWIISV